MFSSKSWLGRAAVAVVGAASMAAVTLATVEPAQAQRGHFGGGRMFIPHAGGGFGGYRGGFGGYRGGYGGWGHRGGWGGGWGYGLGGLGVGLALGSAYGYGYPGYYGYGAGYYGAGYGGGYGYGNGCLRRAWGPFGPHWVNVCY